MDNFSSNAYRALILLYGVGYIGQVDADFKLAAKSEKHWQYQTIPPFRNCGIFPHLKQLIWNFLFSIKDYSLAAL